MQIEFKNWDSYTKEEKEKLLLHWFLYYGKSLYTLDEVNQYINLIDKNQDDIFHLFITAYENNINGQTLILRAIRKNAIDEIINQERNIYETNINIELFYILTIVNSYNNPRPSIPLSEEEIKKQIKKYLEEN